MSPRVRTILVLVALGISGASLWWAATIERRQHQWREQYQGAQARLQQVTQERDHLNQALVEARETRENQSSDMANLQQELDQVQQRLNETSSELASLQQERSRLTERNDTLEARVTALEGEKAQLEARLSDLKELKLAIRTVKRELWRKRFAAWRARIEALKREDEAQLALGNRGYVVRSGVSTLGGNSQLRVHVLQPQAQ